MRRILQTIVCIMLAAVLIFSFTGVSATWGGFSSVDKEIQAGSSFTTIYSVGSGKVAQAFFTLSVPEQLQLTDVSCAQSGWSCNEQNGGYYISPNNPDAVISGPSPLVSLTFKVLDEAEVGKTVSVSLNGSTSSKMGSDANTAEGNHDISGSFSLKITQNPDAATTAQPENPPQPPTLSSLTIENAKISPKFNPQTFVYDVTVPYEVEKLNITATPADTSCEVTVDDTPLSETEETSVIVRLRSSTGTSMYNLRVTREERKKNSNNFLSSINVEGFLLSPMFSSDITDYVVWVPYETEAVAVTATAESEYSTVGITGGSALQPGQFNKVNIVCTSETGLVNEYQVAVYRAAEGEGIDKDRQSEKAKDKATTADKKSSIKNTKSTKSSNNYLLSIIGFVVGAFAAAAITLLVIKRKFKISLFSTNGALGAESNNIDDMFFGENDNLFDQKNVDQVKQTEDTVKPEITDEKAEQID